MTMLHLASARLISLLPIALTILVAAVLVLTAREQRTADATM